MSVIIVTGASRGLGLATARILLEDLSAKVISISRSLTPELETLAKSHQDRLRLVQASVTDQPGISKAVADTRSEFGRIDGLILNAGTLDPLGRIENESASLDAWKTHFDVNFFSLVGIVRTALPALRESHGRVIFVSSGAATSGTAGWGPYNASKAAMNSLCRTLATEEPSIVTVALRPGMVDTDMQLTLRTTGAQHMSEEGFSKFVNAHVNGKLVRPEDAGYVLATLSLRAPAELSGKFINWDGDECAPFRRK